MDKWYSKHQGVIWLATTVLFLSAYAFTTFASIAYVDKQKDEISVALNEIKSDLRDTRDKVYELNGEIPHK